MSKAITSLGRAAVATGLAAALAGRTLDREAGGLPGRVRPGTGRDVGCYPETAADASDGCFPNQDRPGAGCFPH